MADKNPKTPEKSAQKSTTKRSGTRSGTLFQATEFSANPDRESVARFGLVINVIARTSKALSRDLWNPVVIREVVSARLGEAPATVGVLNDEEAVLLFAIDEVTQGVSRQEVEDMAENLDNLKDWISTPCSITCKPVPHDEALEIHQNRPRNKNRYPGSGNETDHSENRPKRAKPNRNRKGHGTSRERKEKDSDRDSRRGSKGRGDGGTSHSESLRTSDSGEETASTMRTHSTGRTRSRSPSPRGTKDRTPYLPRFFGNETKDDVKYPHWRAKVQTLRGRYTEDAIKDSLNRNLRGDAMDIYMRIPQDATDFSSQLLAEMDTIYGMLPDYEPPFTALSRARQRNNESVAVYASRLSNMMTTVINNFPTDKYPERENQNKSLPRVVLDRLYKGLRKPLRDALRAHVKSVNPPTFSELVVLAREIEEDEKGDNFSHDIRKGPKTYTTKVSSKMASIPEGEAQSEEEEVENPPSDAPESDPEIDPDANLQVVVAEVAQLMQKLGYKAPTTKARLPMDQVICYNCEGKGHMSTSCPSAKKPKNDSRGKARDPRSPGDQKTRSLKAPALEANTKAVQKAAETGQKQVTLAPKSG